MGHRKKLYTLLACVKGLSKSLWNFLTVKLLKTICDSIFYILYVMIIGFQIEFKKQIAFIFLDHVIHDNVALIKVKENLFTILYLLMIGMNRINKENLCSDV
jgi:hypothetical protein